MSVGSNDKQHGGVTGKGFEPGKSGNPSGISKEKAQLRRLFEEFVAKKGRLEEYLERLDKIALEGPDKVAILAIREFLDKALGKDFHITGKPEDIKIEIITTEEASDDSGKTEGS